METGMKFTRSQKFNLADKKNEGFVRFFKQVLLCVGGKAGAWLIMLLALWIVVSLLAF